MKREKMLLFLIILLAVSLSCGLPGGGGDEATVPEGEPSSDQGTSGTDGELSGDQGTSSMDGPASQEIASLDELNSYRLHITWRGEKADGSEGMTLEIDQEWVKEPPAQRLTMSGSEPGEEKVPMMEYVVIGDRAWMGMGDAWVEMEAGQAEGMAQGWDSIIAGVEGWDLLGTETVNGVRTRHYASGEEQTMTVADPSEGTVQVSMQGEIWIADQDGLPAVTIRERSQMEGGFFPFALPQGSGPDQAETSIFFTEYDLTDINAPIVISPPEETSTALPGVTEMPAEEPATDAAAGETAGDLPELPPPPESTQTKVRQVDGTMMHYIPLGQFVMGDSNSAFAPERPEHLVFLEGFWMDETEVTNVQYRLCVETGACAAPPAWENPDLSGDQQPVLVPWSGAEAYCQWVGGRLPTEAEWEKAARGTDARLWPWGNEFADGLANLSSDADGYGPTAPVGMFPSGASPYGLHDMAGNAAEWVADWYAADYYAQSPDQSPPGPASGEQKVVRSTIANAGGGPEKCRTVARYPAEPEHPRWHYGFRCASTTQP